MFVSTPQSIAGIYLFLPLVKSTTKSLNCKVFSMFWKIMFNILIGPNRESKTRFFPALKTNFHFLVEFNKSVINQYYYEAGLTKLVANFLFKKGKILNKKKNYCIPIQKN